MKKWHIWTNFGPQSQTVWTLTVTEKKEYFTPIPYQSLVGEQTTYPTLSELLDAFYSGKAEKDRVKQQGGELIRPSAICNLQVK